MRRSAPQLGFLAALLIAIPSTASAIRLTWHDGSTSLTFTETTRCTLVVQAEPGESSLPPEWRLLWTADSAGVDLGTIHPRSCQSDTATVSWFGAGTAADSAGNQIIANFCAANPSAATAVFVFDQPGGSKGKFKVVALDPTDPDSGRVLQSQVVTYNGGVDGEFPPVVLRATASHLTAILEVEVTGAGLAPTDEVILGDAGNLWTLPMSVSEASDTRITASAHVSTPLGEAVLTVGNQSSLIGVGSFPGDGIQPDVPETTDPIIVQDPDPTNFYAKDFSLFYNQVPTGNPESPWMGLFHLMYIRANPAGEGTYLTHAWSANNMVDWNWHIQAFGPSANAWDAAAVWAPSLIQLGPRTCMFYTGVDANGDQSIGYATTTLFHDSLSTITHPWVRQAQPAYVVGDASSWALPDGDVVPGQGRTQFRDPFVIRNPDNLDELLLFNVGEDKVHPLKMTVGVARNFEGSLDSWESIGHYPGADYEHLYQSGRIESPMAMQDPTGTLPWRLIVARGDYTTGMDATYLIKQKPGHALTDTLLDHWEWPGVTLYDYLGQEPYLIGWQATEHLQVGNLHLFAGFDGGTPNGRILISQSYWSGNEFVLSRPQFTGVPSQTETEAPRLRMVSGSPGSAPVRMRLEGVSVSAPRVEIYDVSGRRVRVLARGTEVRGPQEYTWNCDRDDGSPAPSGVYFARMTGVGPQQVVKVAIAR